MHTPPPTSCPSPSWPPLATPSSSSTSEAPQGSARTACRACLATRAPMMWRIVWMPWTRPSAWSTPIRTRSPSAVAPMAAFSQAIWWGSTRKPFAPASCATPCWTWGSWCSVPTSRTGHTWRPGAARLVSRSSSPGPTRRIWSAFTRFRPFGMWRQSRRRCSSCLGHRTCVCPGTTPSTTSAPSSRGRARRRWPPGSSRKTATLWTARRRSLSSG
mmetsp:Transcript_17393/g.44200  ORF Transcript_17393/g.44200 Transcript_17393/m.44200 type:complete len:215 (+) Transcript_17393:383-1027(+)